MCMKFATKTIHVGSEIDEETGSVIPPIYQTSTYAQKKPGVHKGYEYSRSHNPTRTRLEKCLASLENSKYCVVTSSGLSAALLVMHSLPVGSHIVSGNDIYGGSYRLFTTVFKDIHNFHFIDTTDVKATEKLIKKVKPKLLWLETPTNPLLKITDIKKITTIAKNITQKH